MKIVINTTLIDLYNTFNTIGKESNHQILNAKTHQSLFDFIEGGDVDAYIISVDTPYIKRAVDFIKKNDPYVPIIAISIPNVKVEASVDIYMELTGSEQFEQFTNHCFYNIDTYIKTFATLKKLTAKMHDKIEFANCMYDPTRRLLYYKGKEVKKLSAKEGGILEILASNYGEVVKKDVILEKVWHGTDYFKGRSCDVYITYLRNTLKNNKIKLTIKNISGIGLILE